jgi:hypothetical protein
MSKSVCYVCDLIWSGGLIAGCSYLVFGMDQSGAWFVLAIALASCWNCKDGKSEAL